jgi:hypothetical protein
VRCMKATSRLEAEGFTYGSVQNLQSRSRSRDLYRTYRAGAGAGSRSRSSDKVVGLDGSLQDVHSRTSKQAVIRTS